MARSKRGLERAHRPPGHVGREGALVPGRVSYVTTECGAAEARSAGGREAAGSIPVTPNDAPEERAKGRWHSARNGASPMRALGVRLPLLPSLHADVAQWKSATLPSWRSRVRPPSSALCVIAPSARPGLPRPRLDAPHRFSLAVADSFGVGHWFLEPGAAGSNPVDGALASPVLRSRLRSSEEEHPSRTRAVSVRLRPEALAGAHGMRVPLPSQTRSERVTGLSNRVQRVRIPSTVLVSGARQGRSSAGESVAHALTAARASRRRG